MIDVLVSIAVIAILVSLISPALSHVHNAANQVKCASNLRQVGLLLTMYQDDHNTLLPQERPSLARAGEPSDPQIAHTGEHPGAWSSLGWLVAEGYVSTPQIFYCPSHEGTETQNEYADAWLNLNRPIRTNYAYRGELAVPADGPLGGPYPYTGSTRAHAVLVSDAFTSVGDLNHTSGFNTLSTGMSVAWLDDESRAIQGMIADYAQRGLASDEAWSILDRSTEPDDNPNSEGVSGARMFLDFLF